MIDEPGAKPHQPARVRFLIGIAAAISAMIVLQIGASLSKPAMAAHGALEITWLRLTGAALVLLITVRPRLFSYSRKQWETALLLGTAMAVINLCFYQSLLYLPIGVATSIEFIGPLAISAFYVIRINRLQIVWPVLAAVGVVLLSTGPSSGGAFEIAWTQDQLIGFVWAFAAACGWGTYVVLMKRTGTVFAGFDGLAMSLLVAAMLSAPFGFLNSGGSISFDVVQIAFGLAILVPLLPYILEMVALRRMHPRVFGTLMGVEPAIAVIIGWIVLNEALTMAQLAGVACVTLAMVKVTRLKSDRT